MIFLLLGYMWLYIHRPYEIWFWLGDLYLERVYILTCAVLWFFFHNKNVVRNINVLGIFGVAAAILISDFMTNTTGKVNPVVEDWLKTLFFVILLLTSIRQERELKVLLTGFTIIFFVFMLHSYYEFKVNGHFVFRMGIPRIIGVGISMSDPNTFGASIVYFLPVLVPLWMMMRGIISIPIRLFVLASFCLAVICVLDTGSRGAFIGLVGYVGLAAVFSKNRWKILVVAIVTFPIIWGTMDERMQNRYLTLIDPSRGPANAQESAEGRLRGLQDGLRLFRKSPMYGVGPGNAKYETGTGFQTHNFLGQVAGEMGSVGLLAYAFLCCCITINYGYSLFYWKILKARAPTADPYLYLVSQAVFITLILLLLMGVGGHNAFRYTWIWYAAFQSMAVVALKKKVDDAIREQSENSLADAGQADASRQTGIDRPVPQPG
jgi:hypothetical protein